MKYGYARVSTDDQDPALQLAALKKSGCRQTFTDHGINGKNCTLRPLQVATSGLGSEPFSEVTPISP